MRLYIVLVERVRGSEEHGISPTHKYQSAYADRAKSTRQDVRKCEAQEKEYPPCDYTSIDRISTKAIDE